MHRVLRLSLLSILIIGVVVLVAACGGSTDTTAASLSTTSTDAPDTTVSTAATDISAPSDSTEASTAGTVGGKDDPVSLETQAVVGEWKIAVTKVDLNADAALQGAPGYQAPDAGSRYVQVEVTAAYTSDLPDSFSNGLGCQIVGSNGDTFNAVELGLDNSISNTDALTNGDSVSGPLVFVVPAAQLDGAVLSVAPSSSVEQDPVYFALE